MQRWIKHDFCSGKFHSLLEEKDTEIHNYISKWYVLYNIRTKSYSHIKEGTINGRVYAKVTKGKWHSSQDWKDRCTFAIWREKSKGWALQIQRLCKENVFSAAGEKAL